MLSLEFCSLARVFPTFAFEAVVAEISDSLHENSNNLNFGGPAGGSALERALPAGRSIWLVETEIVSELEEQYFIAQAPGQILARMLGVFSKNDFTKMKISRNPVDGFC